MINATIETRIKKHKIGYGSQIQVFDYINGKLSLVYSISTGIYRLTREDAKQDAENYKMKILESMSV